MKMRKLPLIFAAAILAVSLTACTKESAEKSTSAPTKAETEAPLYEPYTVIETIRVARIDQNGEMSTYYDTTVIEKTRLVTEPGEKCSAASDGSEKAGAEKTPKTEKGEKQSGKPEATKQSDEKKTGKSAPAASSTQRATVPETPKVTSVQKGSGAPSLLSVLSPVKNGSYCSLVIMGKPSTIYKLKTEGGEELTAISDENGIASWSFPVKKGASGEMKATAYEGENSLTVSYWVY